MNWTAGIAYACLFYLTVLRGLTHSVPGVGGGGHSSGTTTHSGLLSVCSPSHTALSGPLAAIITHTILSLHMFCCMHFKFFLDYFSTFNLGPDFNLNTVHLHTIREVILTQ